MGQSAGFFQYDPFGNLTISQSLFGALGNIIVSVYPHFKTPYNSNLHFGVQRQLARNITVQADYYHRDINNILGIRQTNLAFAARLNGNAGMLQPGTGNTVINSYGPWYAGTYNGLTLNIHKGFSERFDLDAGYTYAHAIDDALNANFISDVQGGEGFSSITDYGPTDNFVGVPPVVTDPVTGQTNANGSFYISSGPQQGVFVPQAGKPYNGPGLDKGPSDLTPNQIFFVSGVVQLPKTFQISSIFRAQSGFHFTQAGMIDQSGNDGFDGLNVLTGRNRYTAPPYLNVDARLAKGFHFGERVKGQYLLEFFNVLNRANPAVVQNNLGVQGSPFGSSTQVLPGREGQVGVMLEF
jgi:hypothetical protein